MTWKGMWMGKLKDASSLSEGHKLMFYMMNTCQVSERTRRRYREKPLVYEYLKIISKEGHLNILGVI